MRFSSETQERLKAAADLLGQDSINISAFENIRVLLKGIHPTLDEKLEIASNALHTLEKLQEGDIISLSAEQLPEKDEKQKKRKKALLFFINCVKDLRSEVQRIETEFNSSHQSSADKFLSAGRVIKFAKGPLGLVTLVAIIIVITIPFLGRKAPVASQKATLSPTTNQIQVITYQGKQIALSELRIGHAHYPNCDADHYHALNTSTETVTALDGTIFYDPGNCGFGKVVETKITTIQK